jgi:peptidoglycan biosynthesis protein MviN/MurJ (putative lipid II flippase)
MFPLDRFASGELHYGATGLALGASAAAWLEYFLLRRRLAKVLGPHGPAASVRGRILVAAVLAALLAGGSKWILGSTVPLHDGVIVALLGDSVPWLVQPALAASTAFVFGVAYLTVTARLGVGAPLRQLMRREPKHH